ncbi:maleylpyruvate isomerase family mycothiol-dependent enzyme [Nocardia sp. NBC_01009]|uniref:maleylpyruvate isomerase family mycothiol-dependent enzyme n=1 Tax=Nocardia sp. NBC_01009 TaxID=2975996 RepID=UPI0038635FB9|nr:maleylpyruvate isomerase family mycothiol-dependent enzyme [Nocardia sp. NBC_01009]
MTRDLFDRSVLYLLCALQGLGSDLTRPTPCRGWDLSKLLAHVDESIAALREGVAGGRICAAPAIRRPGATAVAHVQAAATGLLGDLTHYSPNPVLVSGTPLSAQTVGAAGALELTVHAWDIAVVHTPSVQIPDELAGDLLTIAPQLVPIAGRDPLFGPPVPTCTTTPGEQLLAYLGRKIPVHARAADPAALPSAW